jgi:uncharacterized protein (DUF305 family)
MFRFFSALFVAVFVITGCASHDDGPPEATFAQMMIPHHEQAIVMADLALANNAGPEVSALAISIQSAQAPEIEQMRGILARYDVEEIHSHGGHDMPGMLTDAELDELGRAAGPAFDVLFLEGMIVHHKGAIVMAQDVLDASDDPEVRQLAEQIIREQEREIIEMEALLGQQS